jgi:hypothetical protein
VCAMQVVSRCKARDGSFLFVVADSERAAHVRAQVSGGSLRVEAETVGAHGPDDEDEMKLEACALVRGELACGKIEA